MYPTVICICSTSPSTCVFNPPTFCILLVVAWGCKCIWKQVTTVKTLETASGPNTTSQLATKTETSTIFNSLYVIQYASLPRVLLCDSNYIFSGAFSRDSPSQTTWFFDSPSQKLFYTYLSVCWRQARKKIVALKSSRQRLSSC